MNRNTDNDDLLRRHSAPSNYIQLALDLGINFKESRKLINGKPTAGQRFKDACDEGFKGNFLDFLKWEAEQENKIASTFGFLCASDYLVAQSLQINNANEFYSVYLSCLDTHPVVPRETTVAYNVPARRWSDEAKYRVRISRLKKRISKKYSIPSLYEEALQKVLQSRPEYFGIGGSKNE